MSVHSTDGLYFTLSNYKDSQTFWLNIQHCSLLNHWMTNPNSWITEHSSSKGTETKNTSQQYHSYSSDKISAAPRNSKADLKNEIKSPVGEIHSVSVENSSDVGIWKHTRLELLTAGTLTLPHTHSCALSHKFTLSYSHVYDLLMTCSIQTLWFTPQVLCPVSLRKSHIKPVFTCVTQARLVCWGTLERL